VAADKDIRYTVTAEDRFTSTFSRLKKDIAAGGDELSRITAFAGRAGSALSVVALGTAGIGAGFGAAFKQLANDLDNLNDASDVLGDTVENISALEDVARRNGAGLDLVVTAVSKLNKVLSEANPNSPVAQALRAIGLDAAELRRLDPTEALQRVAVALNGYANDGNKARLAQELFGKSLKDVAPFLKDVAETGKLNATVTTQQAAEAEKFNKQLAGMTTEAANAGRAIVSDLLPALTKFFKIVNDARAGQGGVFGAFSKQLETDFIGARLAATNEEIERTTKDALRARSILESQPDSIRAKSTLAEFEKLQRAAEKYRQELDAIKGYTTGSRRPANEGGGQIAQQRLPNLNSLGATSAAKAQVSEAQRYLEALQRQTEKTQELTTVQQLLRDIEQGRIDGITPKLRTRLFIDAANLDVLKAQTKEVQEQQAALDELVATTTRRADELDRLLDATPTGRAKSLERQVDIVLRFARANPEDEAIQRQALEAVKQLRSQFDTLAEAPKPVAAEVDRLAVTIDRFAENSIDAITSLVVDGEGGFDRLFKSFQRDVLRALIEDPMRDSMRSVVKIIKDELAKIDAGGGGALGGLAKLFSGNSGKGEFDFDWSSVIGYLFSGSTSRANGGPVRANQLVRWQEGGREWFVPNQDGNVVNESQMRAAGTGASPYQENHFHINGSDPAMMRRELQAALDERDAKLIRSMRNGRARSLVGA
jgi:hypothetical protein